MGLFDFIFGGKEEKSSSGSSAPPPQSIATSPTSGFTQSGPGISISPETGQNLAPPPRRSGGGGGSPQSIATSPTSGFTQSAPGIVVQPTPPQQTLSARQKAAVVAQQRSPGFTGQVQVFEPNEQGQPKSMPSETRFVVANQQTGRIITTPSGEQFAEVSQPSQFEFERRGTTQSIFLGEEGAEIIDSTQVIVPSVFPQSQPTEPPPRNVKEALKQDSYAGALGILFPGVIRRVADSRIIQGFENKQIERARTEQLYKQYKIAGAQVPPKLELKQQQIYGGRLINVGLLSTAFSPKPIIPTLAVAEQDIVSIGIQRTTANQKVETFIGFETTTGSRAGYVKGTLQRTKVGTIKTNLRGIVGRPGESVLKSSSFRVDTLSKTSSKNAINVLYDTPQLKIASQAGKATGSAELGILRTPSTPGSFVNRIYGIKKFRPILTEVPKRVNSEAIIATGVDIGSQNLRLAAGGIKGGGNYAGFIFRLPSEVKITKIPGGKAIKSYQIVDKELYEQAIKTSLAAATKSVNPPKSTFQSSSSLRQAIVPAVSSKNLYTPSSTQKSISQITSPTTSSITKITQIPRVTQTPKINQIPRIISSQKSVQKTIQDQASIQKTLPSQFSNTIQTLKLLSAQSQILRQRQVSLQKQEMVFNTPPPTRISPLIPPAITGGVPFYIPKTSSTKRSSRGTFPVFLRRFGQFKLVGRGKTPGKAFSIGQAAAGRTLGATFKVPGVRQPLNIPGFRRKKTKQGIEFIELPKYRLSTKSELKEIQTARRNALF